MKHIFTVHSPITFFVALNIVKEIGLQEKDVIFITANYNLPFQIGQTVNSYEQTYTSFFDKLKRINLPKSYDRYIDEITNEEEFIAYIDLMHAYQRILVTHKKCLSFNFLEEGTASYMLPQRLKQLAHISRKQVGFRSKNIRDFLFSISRVLRGNTISLLELPYHPQAYNYFPSTRYFTFSKEGYPGVNSKKRVILKPELTIEELTKLTNGFGLSNAILWIEEAYPRVFNIDNVVYKKAIVKTLSILKSKSDQKIWIKLRPGQKREESVLYLTLKEQGVVVSCVPENVIAEALFMKATDLTVIGLVSSLLFYADIFGHKTFSFYSLLDNKPTTAFDDLDIYWEKIERI